MDAVGVVSLGIQLCQGFLKYYHDWQSYHEDISAAYNKVNGLNDTLTLLEDSLNDPFLDAERKSKAHERLLSCHQGLSALRTLLDKLPAMPQPSGRLARAAFAAKRASYPFKTDAFKKIVATVDGLVVDLSLALKVLHLDLSARSHSRVAAVDTTLQTVLGQIADCKEEIRALESKIELLNLANQKKTDSDASALELSKVVELSKTNERRAIMAWLRRPGSRNPQSDHQTARAEWVKDTGQWILDDTRYKRWKSTKSHLWIYGKAGCGKTILCSTVIQDLKPYYTQGQRALAFFYFTFTDTGNHVYSDLLSSMIQQLSTQSKRAYELLRENYHDENCENYGLFRVDLLHKILFLLIQEFCEVVIVFDGVDELPEEDVKAMVLHLLGRIAKSQSNVKILVVSRFQAEIATTVSASGISAEFLPLDNESINEDIRLYVAHQLADHFRLKTWDLELKTRVQSTFEQKADGM